MKALGSFRGTVEGAGVSLSSGGFPQLVLKLHAEEMYDAEAKEWADFGEFEWTAAEANDRDIMSYNILFGEKGATLSCDQIKKIFGWTGDSFSTLANMDLVGTKIQWRNEENNYNNTISVQVGWIDEYDAAPGGTVRQINADELANLDAKFAEFLDGKGAAPSKAPAKGDKGEKAEPKKRGRRSKAQIAADKKAKEEAAAKTETAPPEVPAETPPAMPGEGAPESETPAWLTEPCTQAEAWADVNKMKPADVTADTVSTTWLASIATVGGGKKQAELTDVEWSAVRAAVLDEIGAEILF